MPAIKPLGLKSGIATEIGGADWIQYPESQLFLPGRFYAAQEDGSVNTQAVAANQIWAWPWTIKSQATFKSIRSEVTAVAAGGQFRIALYNSLNSGLPNQLIAATDTATYSSASVGVKPSTAISVTLNPGVYWVCALTSVAITMRSIQNISADTGALGYQSAMGASPMVSLLTSPFAFAALPATAPTAWTNSASNVPLVLFEV